VETNTLYNEDCIKGMQKIDSDSIDAIICDPDWSKKGMSTFEPFAEQAKHILKPSGWCVCYCGLMFLPQATDALNKHLEYYWTLGIKFNGSPVLLRNLNVLNRWRMVLVYQKPPKTYQHQLINDLITDDSPSNKKVHPWQQGEKAISKLVRMFSKKGDLVCDPFVGSGVVPLVCHSLGRKWIGFEIDEMAYENALKYIEMCKGYKIGITRPLDELQL
jgi:site-specific DNA-methyltransferase (adenine-specific)